MQYGLYAAFLPPIGAALFGSSRQLSTGPVVVVSLMAAIGPLIAPNPDGHVADAVLLALMVGRLQLLGLLRLGVLVDFLSHPVVVGFTNAGALIIATFQIGKLFGVGVPGFERHYETMWHTAHAVLTQTHHPTLGMGLLAFALMFGLRRVSP